jgi:phosphopentomutase
MNRAIVLVLDGCGAGAAPDAHEFGDTHGPNTIGNVWRHAGGLNAPNLHRIGFFAACGISGTEPTLDPAMGVAYGRLEPESKGGKDSVTGHWEMMGIVLDRPFPTYPDGFPPDLVGEFERKIGTAVIGNTAASGTAIIAELGPEHVRTGRPILYTSADSVFQLAAHEEVIPIERLYTMCAVAREMLVEPHNVQRVIARPFLGSADAGFTRTERRKDYPLLPPPNLADVIGDVYGIGVVPELFSGRGFRDIARTQSNPEHAQELKRALTADAEFIFANFEDFDMLYGHRNDPEGFARCLEEFDLILGETLASLQPNDLLMVTADHGNDPTDVSTDHTREYVPICLISHGQERRGPLGDVAGFSAVGATVAGHLGRDWRVGQSLI